MKFKFCLYLFFFFISKSLAWWSSGHMLTAQIAKFDLLTNNPEAYYYFESLILDLNPLTDGRSNSFIESASWPDDIKAPGMYFWNKWHFIDKVLNPNGLEDSAVMEDFNTNIIFALQNVNETLINQKKATLEKSIMARFLIHLLGDIHQPLHCTSLVDEQFPKGDMGGNLFMVNFENKTINLHAFWDSGAFKWRDWERPLNESSLTELEDLAYEIMNIYSRDTLNDLLNEKDVKKWTIDSYHNAIKYSYENLINNKNRTITVEYVNNAYELMEHNIALGGFRLSDRISEIYAEKIRKELNKNSFLTKY